MLMGTAFPPSPDRLSPVGRQASSGYVPERLHPPPSRSTLSCGTTECTFSSYKSRGFDLERTGITDPRRLERLFGLVTLAWLSCLRIGVWKHEVKPIRMLAHGRKAMSLVRYGSEHLRS